MTTIVSIERLRSLLERNIIQSSGKLDYHRVVNALELLGDTLDDYSGDNEDWCYLGDCSLTLDEIVIGAYWHLVEWHAGQWSESYRALCSLGKIFDPGFSSGPEQKTAAWDVYELLDNMARE